MLNRRSLLKSLFIAPAIIASPKLMTLSRRSSLLLPTFGFQVERTMVTAKSRQLETRWTLELPSETISLMGDSIEKEISAMLSKEIEVDAMNRNIMALGRSLRGKYSFTKG